MRRILLLAFVSAVGTLGCDKPKVTGPLPSPVGSEEPEPQVEPAPEEPAYHPEERDAIVALKKLGATIPLTSEGRAQKVYLGRSKKLTNQGTIHLKALRDVDELKLGFTPIDDAALANIAHLDKIEVVSLHDTKVAGPGLVHLANMPRLRMLYLGKTQISNDSLVHLTGLPSIRFLDLMRTQITDEALEHLKSLHELEYLDISATEITPAGLVRLRTRLPKLRRVDH